MKEITQKQQKIFSELGLSDIQSQLYITALQEGLISALELSRLTGISRQHVYREAEKLIELGLFDITRKDRRKYIPAHPKTLVGIAQKKIRAVESFIGDIEGIVPSLEAIVHTKNPKVLTKYYEGMNKIQQAFEDELSVAKNTEVLSFVGSIDELYEHFPEEYWKKWSGQFVKQGSRSRMLVHASDEAKETAFFDIEYKRETRMLDDFEMVTNMDVFNDTVLIVSYYDEMAIWIESKMLADSYSVLFESLWQTAKPLK